MRIQCIVPDLGSCPLQISNDAVHRKEAFELTVKKNDSDDNEHDSIDNDICQTFFLPREQVQKDTQKDHGNICKCQKPFIPFSVLHLLYLPPVMPTFMYYTVYHRLVTFL